MYHYETTSIAGFVQQLAVSYLRHGYVFYVPGIIPAQKDPRRTDAKLLSGYNIAISKWARARRKQAGLANLHYLRHERFFLLLATHGEHSFFQEEGSRVRDARRVPIKFAGYAIGHRGGHVQVRIERVRYQEIKAYLVGRAVCASVEAMEAEFRALSFEPYAPVRRQLLCVLRAVNVARKTAGLPSVDRECVRMRRRIVKPFGVDR